MAVSCIVPARLASTRFPRKPLHKICGKELILRTLEQAKKAACFERLICATDSEEIFALVHKEGFEALLTGPAATGSDRVAEAARLLNLDLVVNLQGDEPLVNPTLLREVATSLEAHPDCWITVAEPLAIEECTLNTVVKLKEENHFAVDFSREVPLTEAHLWYKHQGIYAYSKRSRELFQALPQTDLEVKHSLEQLRILNRTPIYILHSNCKSISVDTISDANAVEKFLYQTSLAKTNE